jgi:hypothetical protein
VYDQERQSSRTSLVTRPLLLPFFFALPCFFLAGVGRGRSVLAWGNTRPQGTYTRVTRAKDTPSSEMIREDSSRPAYRNPGRMAYLARAHGGRAGGTADVIVRVVAMVLRLQRCQLHAALLGLAIFNLHRQRQPGMHASQHPDPVIEAPQPVVSRGRIMHAQARHRALTTSGSVCRTDTRVTSSPFLDSQRFFPIVGNRTKAAHKSQLDSGAGLAEAWAQGTRGRTRGREGQRKGHEEQA